MQLNTKEVFMAHYTLDDLQALMKLGDFQTNQ